MGSTAEVSQTQVSPGERIRAMRLARDWSAEDLASRTGLASRTIYAAERGEYPMRRLTRRLIASALGCRSEDLLDEPGTRQASGER